MSEVKPVHRYKAQTLFSFGGAKIEYFPHGPEVVFASDFDAQRLRADTAEADLQEACKTVEAVTASLVTAEQRIAELLIMLRQAWIDECVSAVDCRKIDAALNPNPEAESHG